MKKIIRAIGTILLIPYVPLIALTTWANSKNTYMHELKDVWRFIHE